MIFAREPLASILESGLEALLMKHWREIAHDQDQIKLNPNWPEYFAHERAGSFYGFSLRDGERLVGYSGFIVARSLHYQDHVFAVNDVIFLLPEERGIEGVGMIIGAERALMAIPGMTKIFYHVKADRMLGSPEGDSLEVIDARLEIEERFGIELPDDIGEIGDMTLGAVLTKIGYTHVENHFGKLVLGRGQWESQRASQHSEAGS